ncbi:MAG: tRNA guanosine(34) transglycosylase Tgt [Cyanobacteria bacterium HKST-UBA04]|nr:tRNA guanosine(34) transglycosylase Tgt [Cyanobacteria bacterium HKST-UBA04]
MFEFECQTRQGQARAGRLTTPHGVVETPVFMPVGTHSTLKSMTMGHVAEAGAQIILGNAYHLFLRPGTDLIEAAGGLHGWCGWQKPILTDSGGFQIFSLGEFRQITENGVQFKDPITGAKHTITPERSMAIQRALGADIIMAFDECPPYPTTHQYAEQSMHLTHRWLERCVAAHTNTAKQALFSIVQGSVYEDLRQQSIAFCLEMDTPGYAIGGVSVGEPKHLINQIVDQVAPQLPEGKPRYLMGMGEPIDVLEGIHRGVDMFDCVHPTRVARHGSFFTFDGRRNIKNGEFRDRFEPLMEDCDCYTCQHHHTAYLRHLMRIKEATGGTLLSIHNVRFMIRLAAMARTAILENRWTSFYDEMSQRLQATPLDREGEVVGTP